MANTINQDFVFELLKLCITNRKVLEICSQHLKYQYLPEESYKKVWKEIYNFYNINNKPPTFGILGETFQGQENETDLVSKIKSTDTIGREDEILYKFEHEYIKKAWFISMYNEAGELFKEGKEDDAAKYIKEESEKILNFSIKENYHQRVFADYWQRHEGRKEKQKPRQEKIPTGIHELDWHTRGGIKKGTAACLLARSGVGKSTGLRQMGLAAATRGYNVVHFQLEGTEDEVYDPYDAAWTATNVEDLEVGNISKQHEAKIQKALKSIQGEEGDITVVPFENFGDVTVNQIRDKCYEIEKASGKIDLIIIDYLELASAHGFRKTGSQDNEQLRRAEVGEQLINLTKELNTALWTATQANDIKPEKWNNPDYVLTRSDISKFKNAVNPFFYFFTLNQTHDEYEEAIMRVYIDKMRGYKAGHTIKFYQNQSKSRFYEPRKTLQYFWDNDRKKQKKIE